MNLGATIKQRRKERKLTQLQLAKMANISGGHICLIEKNKREPSLTVVNSIAEALDISISLLIFRAYEKTGTVDEL